MPFLRTNAELLRRAIQCDIKQETISKFTMKELVKYASEMLASPSNVSYKQETKMTRQEAIKKIKSIYGHDYANAEKATRVYEALGLIKFEEEKNIKSVKQILAAYMSDGDNCIAELNDAGYQIVKIGANSFVTIESCDEISTMSRGRTFNGKLISIKQ